MNSLNSFKTRIFTGEPEDFDQRALNLFRFQAKSNTVYSRYISELGLDPRQIDSIERIPFMPIEFFRTQMVRSTDFAAQEVFESSGTTGHERSRHYIEDLTFYRGVAQRIFESFYGPLKGYHIVGLLPSYLERRHASLVFMVRHFIEQSGSPLSGFFLNDEEGFLRVLEKARNTDRQLLVIGVTFGLMDLADKHPVELGDTVVIETGGMKGNRPELTRREVHAFLSSRFSIPKIHSEYGMTELHSQAYLTEKDWFNPPPWMKIMVRDMNDPFAYEPAGRSGGLNVIDLANICSCSFIETGDIGVCSGTGAFKVLGRLDNSDVRGCNFMLHY